MSIDDSSKKDTTAGWWFIITQYYGANGAYVSKSMELSLTLWNYRVVFPNNDIWNLLTQKFPYDSKGIYYFLMSSDVQVSVRIQDFAHFYSGG